MFLPEKQYEVVAIKKHLVLMLLNPTRDSRKNLDGSDIKIISSFPSVPDVHVIIFLDTRPVEVTIQYGHMEAFRTYVHVAGDGGWMCDLGLHHLEN